MALMRNNTGFGASETLLMSRNPKGVFLYYADNKCYVAATGLMDKVTKLPNDISILDSIICISSDMDGDLCNNHLYPCDPWIWPSLRDAANKLQPGLWHPAATFEDHLIQAVKGYIENPSFEKDTFPLCTNPYSTESNKAFENYYRKKLLQSGKDPIWTCWGYLIRQGVPLFSKRFQEDTRIIPYKEPMLCMYLGCQDYSTAHCSKCAWKYYCKRDHQVADWSKHRRECIPFCLPIRNDSNKTKTQCK